MIVGVLIGHYIPSVPEALDEATISQISLPVAALLWLMVYPMLLEIDLKSLKEVRRNIRPIAVTSGINYLIQPFSMYGLSYLFIKIIFASVINDSKLEDEYFAGTVILGGTPCTAMVFVWSYLVNGSAAYTLVQVAFNDILIFVFFIPTMILLLDVSSISIPWDIAIISVAIFMCVPGLAAFLTRMFALRYRTVEWLDELSKKFKPITTASLLATIVLIFIFQGQAIVENPLHVLLIAVPLTVQTYMLFFFTYAIFWKLKVPHNISAPAAMIATSNFFELAVAVAMSLFGAESGATLATVVGVLEEVPIMLTLVWFCNRTKHWFPSPPTPCENLNQGDSDRDVKPTQEVTEGLEPYETEIKGKIRATIV